MQYVFFKEKKVGIGIVWDPPHPALVSDKVPTFFKNPKWGALLQTRPERERVKNYESYVQQLEEYFFTFYRASWNCRLVVLLTFDGSNKILLSLYFLCNQRGFQLYRSMRFDHISRKHFPLWKLMYVDFSFTGI